MVGHDDTRDLIRHALNSGRAPRWRSPYIAGRNQMPAPWPTLRTTGPDVPEVLPLWRRLRALRPSCNFGLVDRGCAYYALGTDTVVLPRASCYDQQHERRLGLLHEMVHALRAEAAAAAVGQSWLNLWPPVAFEEAVAELGAVALAQHMGWPCDPVNSGAYVLEHARLRDLVLDDETIGRVGLAVDEACRALLQAGSEERA